MTIDDRNDMLDQQLTAAFAAAPVADFAAWQQRHPTACGHLNPLLTGIRRTRRRWMNRLFKVSVLAVCLALTFWWLTPSKVDNQAFAEVFRSISTAKSITWRETIYERFTSKDGQRTWFRPSYRECAYLEPGLLRSAEVDDQGHILSIRITDTINRQELFLNVQEKTATLRELAWTEPPDARGPLGFLQRLAEEHGVQFLGNRPLDDSKINMFRIGYRQQNERTGYDFWVDDRSKQVVRILWPTADIFDPETAADRGNPVEKEWKQITGAGSAYYDINYNVKLDPALFSLNFPDGYTSSVINRPVVTEHEMIEFLRALAEFYGNQFPENARAFVGNTEEFKKAYAKPRKERTPTEQKLIELQEKYVAANLNLLPVRHFIDDHAVKDSFQYLGKGVPLGAADQIICWYQLKESRKWRGVYGDLTIKDVAPGDLPLPVTP